MESEQLCTSARHTYKVKMISDVTAAVPSFGNPAEVLEDDILALAEQLKELLSDDFLDKGKYPEGQLPDSIRAVKEY